MTTATLQEYAYLKARAAAIAERLAVLESELETNPDVVGQVVQIDGYGKAEVVQTPRPKYSMRYGAEEIAKLRADIPHELFVRHFTFVPEPKPETKVTADTVKAFLADPDINAQLEQWQQYVESLQAEHRRKWEESHPATCRFDVTPSEECCRKAADELRAEVALLLASEEPVARLASEEPARQVEVRLSDPYGE